MRYWILLSFFLIFLKSEAQYFQTGQDPASIKWRQINTINFQIIYPDYYENQAQKLASMMEKVYLVGGRTLGYQPKKISIILHTQTVKSNGMVAWAPKRMEFYTIPHQDMYAQEWLQQLAIHEFRHLVQIDKVNNEIPKIIKILFGQQGTALIFGAYLPWWYIEGEAVVLETALSNSGRGRFPSFLMEHKALAIEKGNYKYDKAYNGSFKDYVPDHYQFGYYFVGKAREKYGTGLWNEVLNRVGNKPISFVPFNRSLKLQTGLNRVHLYDSVFSELQNEWKLEYRNFQAPSFDVISGKNKLYTNYRFNHWLNDSSVVTYRTSLNRIPSFVKFDFNGNEKRIHYPGSVFNESINYQGEWIVWSEQIPDPRWQHSGKSLIRLFDLSNGKKSSIKTEFTAMSPAISTEKNKVAVVESDYSNQFFISVYSITDGNLINRFHASDNNYFFSPVWINNNEIVVVALFPEGKRLVKINPDSEKMEKIVDDDLGEIKQLIIQGDNLYFIATVFGKNSLFRLNIKSHKIEQVFEGKFGVESPAFASNGKDFILSDYSSEGFRLIKRSLEGLDLKQFSDSSKCRYNMAEKLALQESGVIDFNLTDSMRYQSEKYNKFAHLFNFHSWAPLAIDAENYEIKPGVSILSQNKLGTSFLNFGYEWKVDEKAGNFYGKYTYKGWYPVFDIELASGINASKYAVIEQHKDPSGQVIGQDTVFKRFTWNQTDLAGNIRLPLDFSRGIFNRFFQPEIKYSYTLYKHDTSTPDKFFEGNYQSFTYRIYYQQLLKKSYQDVYPDFGFVADGIYRHSIGETNLGYLTLGQGWIYLPGAMKNHGIRFYLGVQTKEIPEKYSFSDLIRYPRGWGKTSTNNMLSFGSDYKFPVLYPEWSLGGLIYIQRITASLFADYAKLNANIYSNGKVTGTYDTTISSFGIELTGDANFFRFYAPVQIGFRSSYLPKLKNVFYDFLFSIDFTSL